MSKQTKKQKAWSELVKAITNPPKRYNHQRDNNHKVKINKLGKQI